MQFKEVMIDYAGEFAARASQAFEWGKQASFVFDKQEMLQKSVELCHKITSVTTEILQHPGVVTVILAKNAKSCGEKLPETMRRLRDIILLKNLDAKTSEIDKKLIFLSAVQKVMRYAGSVFSILGSMGQSLTPVGSPYYMTACLVQLLGLGMLLIEYRLEPVIRRLAASDDGCNTSGEMSSQHRSVLEETRPDLIGPSEMLMRQQSSLSLFEKKPSFGEESEFHQKGRAKKKSFFSRLPMDEINFVSNGAYFIAGAIHLLTITSLIPGISSLFFARNVIKAVGTTTGFISPIKFFYEEGPSLARKAIFEQTPKMLRRAHSWVKIS